MKHEEADAQQGRQAEEHDDVLALAVLGIVDGQHDHQAAQQQHQRVDAADHPVEPLAGLLELLGIEKAIDAHGEEQRAEEHDLGGQEHPHAQRGGLVLLVEVLVLLFEAMRARARCVRATGVPRR